MNVGTRTIEERLDQADSFAAIDRILDSARPGCSDVTPAAFLQACWLAHLARLRVTEADLRHNNERAAMAAAISTDRRGVERAESEFARVTSSRPAGARV